MDALTKITLFASSTAAVASWIAFSGHTVASAIGTVALVAVNTAAHVVLQPRRYKAKYEAALLVNNVCPSCLIPNGIAELTSSSPEEKHCHCIACGNAYALGSDGHGYIAARRLGRMETTDE